MPTRRGFLLLAVVAAGCGAGPSAHALPARSTHPIAQPITTGVGTRPSSPRAPLTLTYLGVAGWQLEAGDVTVLADPYFSRPRLEGPITPDVEAIARRSPPRADVIVIGHSHVDHVLDAPEVARRTGAQLVGNMSTARYAKAVGLSSQQIVPVRGGEDYAFARVSVRVIPSLHSALDHKHEVLAGEIAEDARPPLTFAQFAEGGTFAYLVRLGGHEVLILSTANFIERELEGLRPDVAIVATGLRHEIHDYTCRLMRALGEPPVVLANHFDDWRGPPVDAPPGDDLRAFVAEVARCAPRTRVILPRHFSPVQLR